jgi:hypothetical protein
VVAKCDSCSNRPLPLQVATLSMKSSLPIFPAEAEFFFSSLDHMLIPEPMAALSKMVSFSPFLENCGFIYTHIYLFIIHKMYK